MNQISWTFNFTFPFSALLLVLLLRFILVNIEFLERKKLILNQVKRASHFVKIIVACPHRLPKLPESTQHKQAIPKKGSLCTVYFLADFCPV
jgi:hypothetical protein